MFGNMAAANQNHPLQQESLHNANGTLNDVTGKSGESFPMPRQLVHRKGVSFMSNITDSCSLREVAETKGGIAKGNDKPANEAMQRIAPSASSGSARIANLPSFRVVSCRFSIPGWTPTRVDTRSKGGCPVYLYENIHDEK